MTTPEAKSSIGCQTPPAQESRDILDAYRVHLDVWKVQNDNYFRRVQVLMMAIQAVLFAATLKVVDLEGRFCTQMLVLSILAVLGMISSYCWMALNDRQNQYLEFCRRTLRNLEHRLAELGVPLRYFTLEAHVFGPLREEVPDSAGTAVRKEGNRHFAEFAWALERYPDQDTDKKDVHELAKVGGGMKSFERGMALDILVLWALIMIGIITASIVRIV